MTKETKQNYEKGTNVSMCHSAANVRFLWTGSVPCVGVRNHIGRCVFQTTLNKITIQPSKYKRY